MQELAFLILKEIYGHVYWVHFMNEELKAQKTSQLPKNTEKAGSSSLKRSGGYTDTDAMRQAQGPVPTVPFPITCQALD